MIKFWSYKKEYIKYKKQLLKNIDKTISKGNIFFGDPETDGEEEDAVADGTLLVPYL